MKIEEFMRLIDEIGFLGTQENLSPASQKQLDNRINEGIRSYTESLNKHKGKKAKQKKPRDVKSR